MPLHRCTRTPLVSVIVPCFIPDARQLGLLDETLGTLAAQTLGDYEAIVVDDGSTADVAAVVRRHPRATTVRQANAGPAVARNIGVACSTGRHVVFLDADDHLLPPALEVGAELLERHQECGFAVGARDEMTFEGEPVPWTVAPPPPQTRIYLALLGFDWYIIPPSSAMFRRQVVEAVGGFRNPWGADDLDFYLRVSRVFPAWCHQAPPVTRYRRYSTSASRDGERMLQSVRAVYAREWEHVRGDAVAEAAFHRGLALLTGIFLDCLVENVTDRLKAGDRDRAARSASLLAKEDPDRWRDLRATDPSAAALVSVASFDDRAPAHGHGGPHQDVGPATEPRPRTSKAG